MKISDIHTLYWHDGNIKDVSYTLETTGRAKVVLLADLYENDRCRQREAVKVSCSAVDRFNVMLSTEELRQNRSAGNIANGYLKGNTLWLYFTDGMLEVTAHAFEAVVVE